MDSHKYLLYSLFIVLIFFDAAFAEKADISQDRIITLLEAQELAIRQNATFQAYAAESESFSSLIEQAKRHLNPELELETSNLGFGEIEVLLIQKLERNNKRNTRVRIAETESQKAFSAQQKGLLKLLYEVTNRYIRLIEVQNKLAYLDNLLTVSENLQEIIRTRVDAGAMPAVELKRAKIEITLLTIEKKKFLYDFENRKAQLAALWGGERSSFNSVVGNLDGPFSLPDLEVLFAASNNNPELTILDSEVELRKLMLLAEKSEPYPDFTIGAGVSRNEEENEWAARVNFSMEIPFFDRNEGNIASAAAQVRVAQLQKKHREIELKALVEEHYYALLGLQHEIDTFEAIALPEARETFNEFELLFQKGKAGLIDILSSKQKLLDFNMALIESKISFLTHKTELERLLGITLEQMTQFGGGHHE